VDCLCLLNKCLLKLDSVYNMHYNRGKENEPRDYKRACGGCLHQKWFLEPFPCSHFSCATRHLTSQQSIKFMKIYSSNISHVLYKHHQQARCQLSYIYTCLLDRHTVFIPTLVLYLREILGGVSW
jgi:hypothetical protein